MPARVTTWHPFDRRSQRFAAGDIADPTKLNFADMVHLEPIPVENRDQLTAEQEAFLDSIRTGSRPVVSGEDGMAAVELAQRIVNCLGKSGI